MKMHTPSRGPQPDEEDGDVKQPPVPPDQEPDVVPVQDPPKPDRDRPPMIAVRL